MNKSSRRGRRRGQSETYEQIRLAARARFLADGYAKCSMRAIAADAGVDAALISYFFGSKRGVFSAAMALPVNPLDILAAVIDGELNSLPERLLVGVLTVWDDPATGDPLRALARTAITEPEFGRLIAETIGSEVVGRLAQRIGGVQARTRAVAFSTQIAGVILSRYLLGIEPIASMSREQVVTTMTPTLRGALLAPQRPHTS
jgi:AcrR family transcriptional regulator